jgi:acyl carrier protein
MKEKIIKILTEIRPEFDFNEEHKDFIVKGLLDSFDIISIVSDLEENFDIKIDGTKILPENFQSVDTIACLIHMSKDAS